MTSNRRAFVVLGTRPEAIKLAPVIAALDRRMGWEAYTCTTGQHEEMIRHALDTFSLEPQEAIVLNRTANDLSELAGHLLLRLGKVLQRTHPAVVIVQGDTTSCFTAALAAFHEGIPVAHVESGLRSRNKRSPFPEEMNRRLTDIVADFCFAPTEEARGNLIAEGVEPRRIWVTGNTAIDVLQQTMRRQTRAEEQARLDAVVAQLGIPPEGRLVLVTGHRRESFGGGLERVFRGIRQLVQRFADLQVVYPVHLNPAVRSTANAVLADVPRIRLLAPVDYCTMVWLLQRCVFVISDSGGIQEEAPSLGKPVLVTRENTERPEGVKAGVAILVGTDPSRIVEVGSQLLTDSEFYRAMSRPMDLYGDGKAARRIVEILAQQIEVD